MNNHNGKSTSFEIRVDGDVTTRGIGYIEWLNDKFRVSGEKVRTSWARMDESTDTTIQGYIHKQNIRIFCELIPQYKDISSLK